MTRRRPGWRPRALVCAVAVAATAIAGFAVAHPRSAPTPAAAAPTGATSVGAQPAGNPPATTKNDPLAREIRALQDTARLKPDDYATLAQLGGDYVQQAKITVDPSYYPKAEGVLQRSLSINSTVNFQAMAGQAALKAAEHNFAAARDWAQRGLAINAYSATLYGSLTDAQTQLGQYDLAFAAAQHMLDLQPGIAALTRAEYVFELRGQLPQAREVLNRALTAANNPSDQAFVHQIAAELAMTTGNPVTALQQAQAGLLADPTYRSLLQTQARAEAALGMVDAAVADYDRVVAAVPQPQYLVEYGEYLDSLGRSTQAQQQYALFSTEATLFTTNGVTLDTDPTLFYADHGDPASALRYGQAGIQGRPFLEMQDAYAWALHVNHRDPEALGYSQAAMSLGTQNALFSFHRGIIEMTLGQHAAAVTDLQHALATNPTFSPRNAPLAQAAIKQLLSHP